MPNNISLFPFYDSFGDDNWWEIGEYSFSFDDAGVETNLNYTQSSGSNVFVPKNDDTSWLADRHNIIVRRELKVHTPRVFYGPNGFACSDSVIGIALCWGSHDSNQRGVVEIDSLMNTDDDQIISIETSFNNVGSVCLRGEVELKLILYLKQAGIPTEDELMLANKVGYVLGELDTIVIRLDGNGSFFPIFEVDSPGESLWRVECMWDDPSVDLFTDYVSIEINRCHGSYKFVNRENGKLFNQQLFIEIIASALVIVIEKLRDEDPNFDCLENPREGSVALAVKYFRDALNINIANSMDVSISLRKYLEKEMKLL